jgi:hypothetical protein
MRVASGCQRQGDIISSGEGVNRCQEEAGVLETSECRGMSVVGKRREGRMLSVAVSRVERKERKAKVVK